MAKYNYESLDNDYKLCKIKSDQFCDGIHQLSTNIHSFINVDETEFQSALGTNTRLYMQEVVLGSIEAMLIGVEAYMSSFRRLIERASKEVDSGSNANLTTDGLNLANDNNWNIAKSINKKITNVNDILYNLGSITNLVGFRISDISISTSIHYL